LAASFLASPAPVGCSLAPADMPRVLVLDTIAQEGLDLLRAAPGIDYEVRTGLKGEALRAALAECDAAICRSGVKITADALAGNRRLRAIVRAGVGTDNIDKDAATRQGVVVMNTPAGNTTSTAEHTIALMLALSRNVAPAYQSLLEGRWDRNKYMGAQLADKSLGIVGLGRIGQAVAVRAKALEMRLLGYDPFISRERAEELGVELVGSVREMLPRIDYLTVHTPLTDETRGLFGAAELELIKPGARLINCARGGIYDEAALLAGLRSGRLAGVALDVFAEEPCAASPLFGQPGVLCTPHLGASTEEAQTSVAVEGVGLLVDFLTTGTIRHAVNMTPIDPKRLAALRGYLDVAYRLGLLLAQFDRGAIRACRLTYRGEVAGKETRLLSATFAAGLLERALEDEVNLVNAELLLRERGIELAEESSADRGAFNSLIVAEIIAERGTLRAAGTLFGHEMARLVQIDHHRLDAYLDGLLLVVGRAAPGGDAIGVLNLDSMPSAEALAAVAAIPDITAVQVVQLPPAGQLPAWLRS
jgi:D-3-phosphoglycerate dehydrogenase